MSLLDVTVGENLLGTFVDLDFSGGRPYYIWVVGVSYVGEDLAPTNMLGPFEVKPLVDRVWVQGKDASGNRRTYSVLVDRSLAAAAAALAHGQGSLTTTPGPMTGNAQALAIAHGALTGAIGLAGAPHSQAAAAGSLTAAILFAVGAQEKLWVQAKDASGNRRTVSTIVQRIGSKAQSTASGALTVAPGLGGSALDVAHAAGGLISWATVTLQAPLYTGPGSILDARYWEGAAPAAGQVLAYDPTYMTILSSGELELTSNNFTALVQYNDGTGWQVGSISVLPSALVGFASGTATASAAFAGGSAALAGQAIAVATAAASVVAGILLASSPAARAQAQAALTALINFVGAAAGQSSASGSLNGAGNAAALSGGAAGASTAAGTVTAQLVLVGAAVALAASMANLATGQGLVGQAQDAAAATGAIDTLVRLASNAQAEASGRGLLGVGELLFGDAHSAAHADAPLDALIVLQAEAHAAAAATVNLSAQIQLAASAAAAATSSGSITALGPVVRAPRGRADHRNSQRPPSRW